MSKEERASEDDKPNANFYHRENSPTAANATDRKFEDSGVMTYKVMVAAPGFGMIPVEVDAATGDRAAELALARYPGAKVAHVEPAQKAAA